MAFYFASSLPVNVLFILVTLVCIPIHVHSQDLTLDLLRDVLERQEDTIIFALIERAKYPSNPPMYLRHDHGVGGSFVEVFVRESEILQAKAGRYQNPEEVSFFAHDLPSPLVPPHKFPKVLHPAAARVNVSSSILDIYLNKLLSLLVSSGDDGNYASAASSDLTCLQALSRRIHFGRFVAEVKFRDAPNDYIPAIQNKDRDTLMNLLTSKSVEDAVVKRVEKKAMIFGQHVTLDGNTTNTGYKVDPKVASNLYSKWVIPLTKQVEVEYLLRRLD